MQFGIFIYDGAVVIDIATYGVLSMAATLAGRETKMMYRSSSSRWVAGDDVV